MVRLRSAREGTGPRLTHSPRRHAADSRLIGSPCHGILTGAPRPAPRRQANCERPDSLAIPLLDHHYRSWKLEQPVTLASAVRALRRRHLARQQFADPLDRKGHEHEPLATSAAAAAAESSRARPRLGTNRPWHDCGVGGGHWSCESTASPYTTPLVAAPLTQTHAQHVQEPARPALRVNQVYIGKYIFASREAARAACEKLSTGAQKLCKKEELVGHSSVAASTKFRGSGG